MPESTVAGMPASFEECQTREEVTLRWAVVSDAILCNYEVARMKGLPVERDAAIAQLIRERKAMQDARARIAHAGWIRASSITRLEIVA